MLQHVVLFKWNDDVDDDHIASTAAALDSLPTVIDTIRSYHHGRDVGINTNEFQYGIVAEFDDDAGYLTYRDHPAHQALIAGFIAGRVAARAAVQFAHP